MEFPKATTDLNRHTLNETASPSKTMTKTPKIKHVSTSFSSFETFSVNGSRSSRTKATAFPLAEASPFLGLSGLVFKPEDTDPFFWAGSVLGVSGHNFCGENILQQIEGAQSM